MNTIRKILFIGSANFDTFIEYNPLQLFSVAINVILSVAAGFRLRFISL